MAQQTINVGAAPNDGTGTPLRTAFQYTNSNFTELYTAVGPSGNNIVVPGNATITGDLTVDTSTLKVDSTNDRVGFGTASPAQFVHFSKSNTSTALTAPPVGGASLRIQNTSSTNNNFGSVEFYNAAGLFGASVNCQFTNQATPTNDLVFVTRGSSGGLEHYRIAADGVCTWSEVGGVAGTAMTLNSTGLGVGVVAAAAKLQAAASALASVPAAGATGHMLAIGSSPYGIAAGALTNGNSYIQATRWDGTATNYDLLIQPNGGNVGIGVTPSAGKGCLQLSSGINFPATQVASSDANTLDDYEEGTFTPTVTSVGGTGIVYTPDATDSGRYTKIGRLVTCQVRLAGTYTGTFSYIRVALPFSAANSDPDGAISGYNNSTGLALLGRTDYGQARFIVNNFQSSGDVGIFTVTIAV